MDLSVISVSYTHLNVQTAAERINGTILKPGQTFSTVKVIKERTVENGYKAAPEYAGGKVVSGVGGGCLLYTSIAFCKKRCKVIAEKMKI